MIITAKKKIISIAEILHLRIFGHEMSETMQNFLGHLSWSFFGGTIAAAIMFALNIIAGRLLGPVEYGKYGLVIALASIFIIPMTLGIDTAITYYVAKNSSGSEKKEVVKSSLWVVGILVALIASLGFYFSSPISKLFNTEVSIAVIAIIFGIFLSIRNIFDSLVKGFHLFRYQSIIKIAEALIIFAAFFLLIGNYNLLTFKSYIVAILAGYIFTNLAIAFKIKNVLGFDTKYTRKIISYGSYAILGSLFGIMTTSFDKILINKYIGPEQLGIYSAYMTASFLLVTQIIALFVNVFFPYMASIKNSDLILKKINRLAMIFFIPAMFGLAFIIVTAIMLFGKNYSLDWVLVLEFSLLGIMTMYFTALWWLIASKGKKGIRFTSVNGIISGSFFLLLIFIFKGNLTLYHVAAFLIIATTYNIFIGNSRYAKIK